VPPTHWSPRDYYDPDPKRPDHVYCTRGGYLEPVDFDPTEFGIPPSSLEATDTSQLLSLLAARMALTDAGYGPGQRPFDRRHTSVILGVTGTQELVIPLASRLGHPRWRRAMLDAGIDPRTADQAVAAIGDQYVSWQESSFPGLLGNVVAGRISNRFDLGGTNCAVDAACASSLSALNLALLELWAGRSRMAITGGADMLNDIFMHMCFAKSQILSASGDARPFSRDADGTVLGEGVGLVVLKPLAAAEKDGDRIYAVIRGIGASSDARSSSIYAPRREGQVEALRRAYASAGVPPETVEMVEAHGTGTRVGDQVEFKALKSVFEFKKDTGQACALGSVKSMIGHAKAAAGAAGLIKAVLALHHRVLLPTLKVEAPDPGLDIAGSPFYLNTASRPWTRRPDHPRRCAVSAFGFGGSNFHVVLEEYPDKEEAPAWDQAVHILVLGAADQPGLQSALEALRAELGRTPSPTAPGEAAHRTCAAFDTAAPWRLTAVVAEDQDAAPILAAAAEALKTSDPDPAAFPEGVFFGTGPAPGKLAVLFPGQGSQYPRMGRDLACLFPEARQTLEIVQEAVSQPPRLSDLIYPPADFSPDAAKRNAAALQPTDRAQPAIGALSAAWYRVLARFGLAPDALAGHSFGELTALWAAGRIDLETFARLSALRGKVMADAGRSGSDPGTMLAVKAPLEQLDALALPEGVILANRNSPRQGVFSGPTEGIAALEKQCRAKKLRAVRLPVAAAFHSALIADARQPFAEAVRQAPIASSAIPVYGNTRAAPYPTDTEGARRILADQMVQPVDFVGLVNRLYDDGCRTFLEVGPKAVLTGLVDDTLAGRHHVAMTVDRSAGRGCGITDLAVTLARLAAMGHRIDLSGWESPPAAGPAQRMKIPLTGANHRSQPKKSAPQRRPAPPPTAKAAITTLPPVAKTPDPPDRRTLPTPASTIMKTPEQYPTGSPDLIAEALKSVQAGLKAIESMQARTTEAHQKFLDVQQEASRTLQQMMASAERLSQALPGGITAVEMPLPLPAPVQTPAHIAVPAPRPTPVVEPVPRVTPPPQPPAVVEETAKSPGNADDRVLSTLVAVVSELTGYPESMLGADMDLEADLGIDSIKRVEILSALEERLPGRGSISAEKMTEIKTIGDIAALLGAHAPGTPEPASDAPAQASAPPPQPANAPPPAGEALSILVDVVSELTGYPESMLCANMDLEADLGIDSIKRVEILSALEERLPGQGSISAEQMSGLKTLGDIAAALDGSPPKASAPVKDTAAPAPCAAPPAPQSNEQLSAQRLDHLAPRRFVKAVSYAAPARSASLHLAPQGQVLVAGGDADLGPLLARHLMEAGLNAVHLPQGQIETALAGDEGLPRASGLVMVAESADAAHADLKRAFGLTRRLARDLARAADNGGAMLAAVTRLDGSFGFLKEPLASPSSGALSGLVKTAALELEGVVCRVLDIGADWADAETAAATVTKVLVSTGPTDPVEIGVTPSGCYRLELVSAPYAEDRLDLAPGAVVVATGGARGVTAEALLALAREVKPVCLILGRSPLPGPEPEWIGGLYTPAEIRQALLKTEFAGRKVGPRQLAERAAQLNAEAEVRRNLERLQAAGATVIYRSVDVRRRDEVARALEALRATHGPIRALIHGAGTLADRRIEDKTDAQFDAVFDTKVRGLEHLLALTADDPLRYVVLFSSVAARYGNTGQADYAMANEWLNKTAVDLARRRPEIRVLAINWGPWDGGMVDEGLKRHFANRGVSLLDPAAGAAAMVRAMADPDATEVEMVVGGDLAGEAPACESDVALPDVPDHLEVALAQEVDLERFPVLADHVLGGLPVVPLALMIEWLGHTALHTNPGLTLVGLDDLRVLSGIKLDGKPHPVKLMSGASVRRDGLFEVPVALFNGNGHNGSGPVHSRARALLADMPLKAPAPPPPPTGLKPFPLSTKEAYGRVLFHGERLRGIRRIEGCSDQGMVARLAPAPTPDRWIRQPLRSRWITDPLVLDAAFQMAILWSHVQLGMVSLPACAESYRQYRRRFPAEGVTAEMHVVAATSHRLKADIAFLDAQRQVVAILSGYEATMDPGLEAAFKAQAA
jgi:acyl transferase domain-containing protein/NAD(P)-dependent dehydrogenase (short-subunit alcohol dehydrogenase family)/acyl carrier protein